MKKNAIILHTGELKHIGLDVKPLKWLDEFVSIPHRDDHYMFVIQHTGRFICELDFDKVILEGPSLCFVAPGQVHQYINHRHSEGWLIFAEDELISHQCREIFNTYLNAQQSVSVAEDDAIFKIAPLLEEMIGQRSLALRAPLIHGLTGTLATLIASKIMQSRNSVNLPGKQKYNTIVRFKQLVRTKYRELKQVKAYASLLNITPLYLNEVAKEMTGFSASHWINQEVLLEAKRLLYYTALDVKEVAYELGYEDPTYFSRFFKKNTGITASAFRSKKP